MAARKAKAYKVVGAVAVIRKDKHERYLDRGTVFRPDALDEENAKHLLAAGLIAPFDLDDDESDDADDAAKQKAEADKKAADDAAKQKAEADKKAADDAAKQKTPPAS